MAPSDVPVKIRWRPRPDRDEGEALLSMLMASDALLEMQEAAAAGYRAGVLVPAVAFRAAALEAGARPLVEALDAVMQAPDPEHVAEVRDLFVAVCDALAARAGDDAGLAP